MLQSLLGLLVAILAVLPVASGRKPPIAKTVNGAYKGRYITKFNQEVFRGVRFGNAPRLRNPQPLNQTWDGVRSAEYNGPACWVPWLGPQSPADLTPLYQRSNVTIAEDCLNLNIHRPAGYEGKKLPVVVYIYGGGWIAGFGAELNSDPSYILQASVKRNVPLIAVTLNYRVGFLGFPGGEKAKSERITNLGLKDQRLALQWLQENIAGFGGDPSKVTLWGQSGGSISIYHQILAYGGKDADKLFRGGIMVSGSPYVSNALYPNNTQSVATYEQILINTGCTDAEDPFECLRQAPVEELAWFGVLALPLAHWPVIDGDFISEPPVNQITNGRFSHKIKLFAGANSDEGLAVANDSALKTEAEVAAWLRVTFPNAREKVLEKIPAAYSVNSPSPPYSLPMDYPFCEAMHAAGLRCEAQTRRAAAIMGDLVHHAPRRDIAEKWTAKGGTFYSYRFDTNPTSVPIGSTLKPGFATHSAEIAYFFNFPSDYDMFNLNPTVINTTSHHQLSDGIAAGISSFISTGDPNTFKVPYFPKWPKYSLHKPVNMVYNVTEVGKQLNVHIEADTWRQAGISLWQRHPIELQVNSPFRPS